MMNTSSIHQKIEQLSPQLLVEVENYVDFLLQKHQPVLSQLSVSIQMEQRTSKKAKRSEQPLIGLWKEREEMQDVEKYVRQLRKPRY